MKQYLAPIGWALGMLVLILDGRTAMAGAAEGVELCIRTLIPNLFPFFVLSAMLTSSLSGSGLLLTGILGGYPVGAGNVARAYRAGQLTAREAERMAVLFNCAGPSFIFGVVCPILGDLRAGAALWGVYLLSVCALWLVLPKTRSVSRFSRPLGLQQAVTDSLKAMAGVCGWVILFRVLMAMADRWVLWLLPDWGQVAVYGVLELSGGCLALGRAEPGLRFILAAGFISFGGLCVMLQTASVARGISLGLYFPGKIFQAAVSMALASLMVPGTISPAFFGGLLAAAAVSGVVLRKSEKRCGNRRPVIV